MGTCTSKGALPTDYQFLWSNALLSIGMFSSLAVFYLGYFMLGFLSAVAVLYYWENDSNKETVFQSSWLKRPTYRIPALVFQDNDFLAFCEKRLTGSSDCGPMDMVLKRGNLDVDGVSWGQEVILYPEEDCKDTTKRRPMNAVPIVVDKDHVILMFNTYPENMSQCNVTNSDTRVWQLLMKHSYDGGKTWGKSEELPVDKLFSGLSDCGVPTYCAIGPGHAIKLESSGRLIVSGNVNWPKAKKQKNQPFAIVSDDNGKRWKMGGLIPLPTFEGKTVSGNECQPVDMGSNNIVINCRTPGTFPRMQCYSADAGDTFAPSEVMQTLIEPRNGCQGSTLGFKALCNNDDKTCWALFSNPANTRIRRKLSIRLSKDGCKTWSDPPIQVLECFGSGYSDLTSFTQGDQLKFACLFERNKVILRNIDFIIFKIDVINKFK